jgi:hypothetical protein
MKRVFSILFAVALVLGLSLVATAPVVAATIINVPGDYTTIQAAINAASPGDTIVVAAGTYDYNTEGHPAPSGLIKVTKGVTIKAADGVRPVIDGTGFDGVFKIHPSALNPGDTVIIEGFEIIGDSVTDIAVTMQGCFDVTPATVIIRDNYFHGMNAGIDFWGAGAYLPSGWTSAVAGVQITDNKFYALGEDGVTQGFGVMIEDPANWATAGNTYAALVEGNEFYDIYDGSSDPGVGIVIPRANDAHEAANAYMAANSFSTVSIGVAITDGDVSDARITNNNFDCSTGVYVMSIDNGPVDARYNWWGADDGPGTVGTGSGAYVSNNVDYVPWACKPTTGGLAYLTPSGGMIEDLTPVSPPAGAPVAFPYGMFSFTITGLTPGGGGYVTITVELPGPVPVGSRWWKYQGGSWYSLPIDDDDGDNVITVTLHDGALHEDTDGSSTNGEITDPGGPSGGAVGWETYAVSKARVLLPWIALFAAIMAGASLLVLKRRRTKARV